ncbi:hypothetical protein Vadar_001217 [Vaccinium darrowii]|uniref:Uncharacterized protein n=1 Tax=Vaccinium darrowii TaxID=229202 RepID=A0ACB7WXB6_9ERIC|nr:hypothetical protein Vadar_001217 [Vaccinium darrowii]
MGSQPSAKHMGGADYLADYLPGESCDRAIMDRVLLVDLVVEVRDARPLLHKKLCYHLRALILLAELAKEAGLPDGVLNIVHGTNDIVNAICDDDEIKAISFVGSNTAGMHIYARASARGKRVQVSTNIWITETAAFLLSKHGNNNHSGGYHCTQSNAGAKNHGIVMPDANMDANLNALVAAGFGATEQRCMALSTMLLVSSSKSWVDKLVDRAEALKAKERIFSLIQSGVESGAKLLLDGRNIVVPGYEQGNFIGPTILSDVTADMECYKEEIFGPVLLCLQVSPFPFCFS